MNIRTARTFGIHRHRRQQQGLRNIGLIERLWRTFKKWRFGHSWCWAWRESGKAIK